MPGIHLVLGLCMVAPTATACSSVMFVCAQITVKLMLMLMVSCVDAIEAWHSSQSLPGSNSSMCVSLPNVLKQDVVIAKLQLEHEHGICLCLHKCQYAVYMM